MDVVREVSIGKGECGGGDVDAEDFEVGYGAIFGGEEGVEEEGNTAGAGAEVEDTEGARGEDGGVGVRDKVGEVVRVGFCFRSRGNTQNKMSHILPATNSELEGLRWTEENEPRNQHPLLT